MAIETNDLLVLQKNGGGELRKATVSALLAQVTGPNLDDYLQKPGAEGDFVITEEADGTADEVRIRTGDERRKKDSD